jgi:phosphatidylglycerol---prolipoprotein diacylglyceryl transferase
MRYPDINPVLVNLGPMQIRWYGLMYIIGFICAFFVMVRISRNRHNGLKKKDIEDLLSLCILGLVLGARLGYCVFYNLSYYLSNPLKTFAVWEGGMSFHGGIVGLLISGWIFSVSRDKSLLMLADIGAVAAPPGLFFGRIGNFINGELFGRVTNVPWGMIFPHGGSLPRHPSQLYEAFFEGIVLFLIMYALSLKTTAHGTLFACFLIFYGGIRFCLEYFREPDAQLGFVLGTFTMGQILCVAMICLGIVLLLYNKVQGGNINS